MSEYEQHQKIKYGDIIYIELSSQKDRNRHILRANSFNILGKCYVEVEQLNLINDNIFYKDFINNLFMIFPIMKDDFIKNQNILKEKLALVKDKMKTTISFEDNTEIKEDITKLIHVFKQTKQDIYSEKDNFLKEIGQPINFKKEFILIHFDSQNFVQINEEETPTKNSKLVLTDTYSEDCIFLFNSWSSLDNNAKYVFSNQNLYICKKEKNLWSNSHFLTAEKIDSKRNDPAINNANTNINLNSNNNDNSKYDIDKAFEIQRKRQQSYVSRAPFIDNKNKEDISKIEMNNINEVQEAKIEKKFILGFNENQSNGSAFKIKICSNYIDPSKGLLSFSSPVWLVCQNIERHLTITPNLNEPLNILKKKEIKKRLNTEFDNDINIEKYDTMKRRSNSTKRTLFKYPGGTFARNRDKREKKQNKEIISFDYIDKSNSLNNIYGLFYVEQCETKSNLKGLTDDYLKNKLQMKIDLKMSSFVKYHEIIRFLHATTRKYLSFRETINEKDKFLVSNNNKSNDVTNDKTFGELALVDIPDENCNWMFMESYKILNDEEYFDAKSSGVEFGNKEKQNDKPSDENGENNKKSKKKVHDKKEGDQEDNVYKIKNKEILRIFHVKSQKFLCFQNIYDKLMGNAGKLKNIRNDIYNNENVDMEEKSIVVDKLSLSKTPYDSDLIRLIPSNSDQSWEIRLVLYYSEVLTSKIQAIINFDTDTLAKNMPAQKRLSKDNMITNNSLENFSINNRSTMPLPQREKKSEDKLKTLK